jgi:hypothetical protein
MFQTRCSWTRLGVGVVAAFILGALLAPSTARAACGDGFMPLAAHHKAAAPDRSPQLPAHPLPRPCTGRLCRQNSSDPLPVPSAPAPTTSDDLGTLPTLLFLPAASRNSRGEESVLGQPVRRATDVYHPPR